MCKSLVASAQEFVFSLTFVCLFVSRITQNLLDRFQKKFGGRVAHVAWKKLLDFGGNTDHVGVRVKVGSEVTVRWS